MTELISVKAFLNMVVSQDNLEEGSRLDVDVKKAIDLNPAMVFDQRVRSFIINQLKVKARELAYEKILVKGDYKYTTGDLIALMEHIVGMEVTGFLKKSEQFCSGKAGEYVMMRNPLPSWHEVHKTNFIESMNSYIKHLDNVVQVNTYDLTMAKLSGMDFDGDKIFLSREPILLEAVIDDLTIVNVDDKVSAKPKEYKIEEIIKFELKNLANLTPVVTNINTLIQSYALEKGDLRTKELEIATCKQLQAEFIDSIKKGTNPTVPEVFDKYKRAMPYFQKYIYEDLSQSYDEKKYKMINSPLNLFCRYAAENLMNKLNRESYSDPTRNELNNVDSFSLVRDLTKVNGDEGEILRIAKKIEPVYIWYAKEKQKIWNEQKKIHRVRPSEEDKEQLKLIKAKWKKLYEDTRQKLQSKCDNPSILTSACVTLEYAKDKDSFIFGWIATEDAKGILENIKSHEDNLKIDTVSVPQLDRRDKEYGGLLLHVENGVGYFRNIDDIISVNLPDGKYPIIEQMGYHFAEVRIERESEVEISESDIMETSNKLKPLQNYKASLVGLDNECCSLLQEDKLGLLKEEGRYFNLYVEGKRVGGISKNTRYNVENRISLNQYQGEYISVKKVKENGKSIDVILSTI